MQPYPGESEQEFHQRECRKYGHEWYPLIRTLTTRITGDDEPVKLHPFVMICLCCDVRN